MPSGYWHTKKRAATEGGPYRVFGLQVHIFINLSFIDRSMVRVDILSFCRRIVLILSTPCCCRPRLARTIIKRLNLGPMSQLPALISIFTYNLTYILFIFLFNSV